MWEEFKSVILPITLLIAFVAFIVLAIFSCVKEERQIDARIVGMNYNLGDVEVYLDMTRMNKSDFLKSEGLRRQYETFHEGKAGLSKKENSSGSNLAVGMAIGMAAGSAMSSGRR